MSDRAAGVPEVIGVVGAGTMGAGIAQLAASTGARALLHDPDAAALQRGIAGVEKGLARLVERERMTAYARDALVARLEPADSLDALAPAGLVIEAAPERLDIKLSLFGTLAGLVADDCVLATNTSSLSVTEIAAAIPQPQRVVGMHFFNPAPVMKLLEVVRGEDTSDAVTELARAVGEAMGKTVIDAADVAGFLVNRCNRPYSLESLYLLEQRVATVEQIDRIQRGAGGFRMGAFELMDLVGIETNHAVAESMQRQSFGEPRYRPSPLAARKVAAGHLGRKTGRGWYVHGDTPGGAPDPEPPPLADAGTVAITGALPVAGRLRDAAREAGWTVLDTVDGAADLVLDFEGGVVAAGDMPRAVHLHAGSLHSLAPRAAGFHVVAPLEKVALLEITSTPLTEPASLATLERFAHSLGWAVEHVQDAPGLVLGRVVAQLVNEAHFIVGEGNGTPADVDAGMQLGVNHPRGPIAWLEVLGVEHVASVLGALHRELGEPRYRLAPALARRLALAGAA